MQALPDENYCLFGAEALLKRLSAFEKEIDGVCKADDIECIHRMRVASRRIRSAFRLFETCLASNDTKKWRKQIRLVTRSLGVARDLDVQIEFLHGFLNELQDNRYISGIKRLLLRLKQRRDEIQPEIILVMDQLKNRETIMQLTELCRIIRNLAQLHQKNLYSKEVYKQSFLSISLCLEEFLHYKNYVYQPDKTKELHAMRIASKHLRYTMEIFASLYEDELKEPIDIIRDFQTILGDFNDCVTWVNYLSDFIEEEKERTSYYFGHTKSFGRIKSGITFLQEDRREKQAEYYNIFLNLWEKTQEQNIWENLKTHILIT